MSDEQKTNDFFNKLMKSHDTNWMTGSRNSTDTPEQHTSAPAPLDSVKIDESQQLHQPSDQRQPQQYQHLESQSHPQPSHRSQYLDSEHLKSSNNPMVQPSSKVQQTDIRTSTNDARPKNTTVTASSTAVHKNSKTPDSTSIRKASENEKTTRTTSASKRTSTPEVTSSKRGRNPGSAENCRLFVGGLPFDTTKEELTARFERYGPIVDVAKRAENRYGFVEYADQESAYNAVELMDGRQFLGCYISVQLSKPRYRPSSLETTNSRSNVFSRLSSHHDTPNKKTYHSENKDKEDKRLTTSGRRSTSPGRNRPSSRYSDTDGKQPETNNSSKRYKDTVGSSKRSNDVNTPSYQSEATGPRDGPFRNSSSHEYKTSTDRHNSPAPSPSKNQNEQSSQSTSSKYSPSFRNKLTTASPKDIQHPLKRSPSTSTQMENMDAKRMKTLPNEPSGESTANVTGTNLSNADVGQSSDTTAYNLMNSTVTGNTVNKSGNEDPRLLLKPHTAQSINAGITESTNQQSSTTPATSNTYLPHQPLSFTTAKISMVPSTNNIHNMPIFMPSSIPFLGSNDGSVLHQPPPPIPKPKNERPIIQLICTSITLPPDVVARMEDHLIYYLPSMKCRTVFFPSTTSTREDVLKRMHMKNVQAVIMIENGYEQHGKIFLQVYDQLVSGNDSLHFDEYEFITIYDVVAILQQKLTMMNESASVHQPSSVIPSPPPPSFIRHTPPPIKTERTPTEPTFPPPGTTVPQSQQFAMDLLLQLQQQQQRHTVPFPVPQSSSPPPPISTASSTLEYCLALSSHQPFDQDALEKIVNFLDKTQHQQLTSTVITGLQLLAQRTLGQLKNIHPGLQPDQEMSLQNYLVSYLQRLPSQPPPSPFPNQAHNPNAYSISFPPFYKHI